jgi:hypothetical protein
MEWGPRALGNRSILGDPRRADMKDILNLKIKRRESFRPFAPSVLKDAVADWFEEDDAVPFMMQVFQIREEKRALIPAVTHVDGSGRLQTVSGRTNPRYHRLITAFRDLTGVPMVLNTRSMRTSRSSAPRARRSTASCAPTWMYSSSAMSCSRARKRRSKECRVDKIAGCARDGGLGARSQACADCVNLSALRFCPRG